MAKLQVGINDLATTHPALVKEWHPTKNGKLKPGMVTADSDEKVWWMISYDDQDSGKHFDFEWQATISNRVAGSGCPFLSFREL